MIFLDGVYVDAAKKSGQQFVSVMNHSVADIVELTHKISVRVARYQKLPGLIEADEENTYLVTEDSPDHNNEMIEHRSHSITYRIAVDRKKGKKYLLYKHCPLFLRIRRTRYY